MIYFTKVDLNTLQILPKFILIRWILVKIYLLSTHLISITKSSNYFCEKSGVRWGRGVGVTPRISSYIIQMPTSFVFEFVDVRDGLRHQVFSNHKGALLIGLLRLLYHCSHVLKHIYAAIAITSDINVLKWTIQSI